MKRFFPAFLVLLFSLAACQREVDDVFSETDIPGVSGSFTAKIDGVPWTATRGAFAHFSVAANGIPAFISIFGAGTDKKIIGLTLMDSGVHQYTFLGVDAGNINAGIFQDSSLPDVNSFVSIAAPTQPSGTATVRNIDRDRKTISGTFNFIAYRELDGQQLTITEGVFTNIPYTDGSGLPPASSKDTFTVKIDGTPFVPHSISGVSISLTNSIVVTGVNEQGTVNVGLNFPNDITPGTYEFDLFGTDYVGVYNTGTGPLAAMSGTLEILEHNTSAKRIRGRFSFRGEDIMDVLEPAQLTEGYFAVTYQ